jgi:hypothetical protein
MAITFLGSASLPADNASQAGPGPLTVTPVGSMLANDFVIMIPHQRLSGRSENFDFTNTGGQDWTFFGFLDGAVAQNIALWCCRFNGTWSASPAIEQGNGDLQPFTAVMLVFRPSSTSMTIDIDFSPSLLVVGDFAAATTVTIPAITTRNNNAVAIALWVSQGARTWGTLTGTVGTWTNAVTQIRNTNGSGMSFSAAYQAIATAGTTGTVSKTQSVSTAGIKTLFSIYERDATQDFASVPAVNLYTDFETSTDGTAMTAPIANAATRLSSADGTWSLGGAGGPNLTIENDAQKALSPRAVSVSGTQYTDASGTRGMRLNHFLQGGSPYILTWQKTSGGYPKVSCGCFFTTDLAYATFKTITFLGLQESGGTSGYFAGLPSVESTFLRLQSENTPSETLIAANVLRNTTYWVTMQYDTAANVGSMRVYDPTTWTQVGVSAVGRMSSGSATNVNQLQLGDSHGEASTLDARQSFYDNVVMDWTNGVWPLGPSTPAAAANPGKPWAAQGAMGVMVSM